MIATIEAQTESAIARLHRASAFRDELGSVRGTGTVDGVTVTVSASGTLLDVDFTGAGLVGGQELRRRVLAAHRSAQRDVADRIGDRARSTWGDDPVVARIETAVTRRTGPRAVPDDLSR